jgi:arylsulfatase A-like enzyme
LSCSARRRFQDVPVTVRRSPNCTVDLSLWENYYAEEFTYLVTQLQSHGIMDDTMIVWGSEIDSGNEHNHHNMPFLMAAGANLPVQRGKVVRFPISYPGNMDGCIPTTGTTVSHNDLLRTVLHAVGAEVPSVGSAEYNEGVLTSLLA